MREIKIQNLTREQFNKLVEGFEKQKDKLGIKNINAITEYTHVDENKTMIKLTCNEH